MFKMLIDTCVWLDVAKDPRLKPILGVLEELVRLGMLSLVVPRIVLDEFRRNRDRIARESAKSLSAHFRIVKDAVSRAGGSSRRMKVVISHLEDVDHKIPILGGEAVSALDRIEKLLTTAPLVETSDDVRLRAAGRAIDKRAPFHHDKNAMADAILMEIYTDCVRAKSSTGIRFAFVTHNKADFSLEGGDQRLPHPDFASAFSRIKSLYFISLPQALRRIEPSLVTDIMLEHSWTEEPRGRTEIVEAEDLLFHQVWFNRHCNMLYRIKAGKIKVVEKETYPRPRGAGETIQRNVLKMAVATGRRVEREYGKENLGPWSDFEWGMINGKLSALRWVLGSEWDFLDT